ncbi:Protein OBERON 2 [Acorus calamus]|uniref:OBERON-like protein n=1 Tax=Acorus calamus TaxID=4465 RepID=A0AAV9DDY0_ACOCL|nr:Protein OBERON 2 [Acorus calamus]
MTNDENQGFIPEHCNIMGTSSGAHHQSQPKMLPPGQQLRPTGLHTSLSLAASDAGGSPDAHEPVSNSDPGNDSATESASSRETWPIETNQSNGIPNLKKSEKGKEEGESKFPEPLVVRSVASSDKLTLRDIARERVDIISDRMLVMPEELCDELRNELRTILEGTGGSHLREEFLFLQKLVQGRADLTAKTLIGAHRVQLEILVSINTGIQAFLHPNISLPQVRLIEIFVYKRCRNIACQSPLPADDCGCNLCTNRNGFCCLCMCVICNKFDFEVNTCRWIGCDLCSHWTHTDCAIRVGQIGMGQGMKNGLGPAEMLFRCQACNRTSELLGWVKDVFQHCAPNWDREALMRELDFVSRIFRGSEDARGRKLFWKCEELIEKMRNGFPESTACGLMMMFFQEVDGDPTKASQTEEGGRLIAPQEACNRIADVVQEAVRKMEMVAEEKMRMFKRARLSLEACDRELEDKAREVNELKMERQRKKQQIEELESIVRLKQKEAEMFQMKANEAKREAERLQQIALAKTDKSEEEYASRYLKQRLEEAEAEKQYLFEKFKLQESQRGVSGLPPPPPPPSGSGGGGSEQSSQMMMLCKIQDLLKNVYNAPNKSEGQSNGPVP